MTRMAFGGWLTRWTAAVPISAVILLVATWGTEPAAVGLDSFNLALGSAMASIGLTIPAVAVASIWLDGPLVLGLGESQIVLLAITAVVGALTVLSGRATLQESGVHLALFGSFLSLAINP